MTELIDYIGTPYGLFARLRPEQDGEFFRVAPAGTHTPLADLARSLQAAEDAPVITHTKTLMVELSPELATLFERVRRFDRTKSSHETLDRVFRCYLEHHLNQR